MKGIICYYSSTGNTRLACQYIARKSTAIEFALYDIVRDKGLDPATYDLVGFAAFADYIGPSRFFIDFVRGLPVQAGKPAFVFDTFGGFNGATLRVMAKTVASKGFTVAAGHALHTPENIPTMIMSGNANEQAPDAAELAAFDGFIALLDRMAADAPKDGWPVYRPPLLDRLVPALPRTTARRQMGVKSVDPALCTRCGICFTACPYSAISMPDLPVFDQHKCYGCWACYNLCPAKAIYTRKYRGAGHYPGPIAPLLEKLAAERRKP
jgi:ferredoxin/flavodoxin